MAKKKRLLEAKYGSADRPLKIGEIEIPCYVLEDGKRVIVQSGLLKALGITKGGASSEKYKKFGGGARLVSFLDQNDLISLTDNKITPVLKDPILFAINKTVHYGYDALLLQEIVRIISKAYLKGKLNPRNETIGINAELLDDAFAKVGILALVDEATGYEKVREKDALQAFLNKFLQEEQAKWVKTFPDEFFEMIFKMKNWTWHYASTKKPQVVGHYINDFVYSRLGPSVLEELKKRNTDQDTGKKRGKQFQFLTPDYGHPKLKEHLNSLVVLGKASGYNWNDYKKLLNKAFPKFGETLPLDFRD